MPCGVLSPLLSYVGAVWQPASSSSVVTVLNIAPM
jgi:hypothetical protein